MKICGLTRLGDARLALGLGADELGFVLAPSPRRVEPELVKMILEALRGSGKPFRAIGVFVNEAPAAMREILAFTGLEAAQVHGDEDAATCTAFDFPWYRALRPGTDGAAIPLAAGTAASGMAAWTCPRILADAAVKGSYGGTGTTLALPLALAARDETRTAGKEFFLAGGLGPANVLGVLAALRGDGIDGNKGIDGIDASSGLEEAPGIKSPDLLRAYFAEIAKAQYGQSERKESGHAAR
ncbi:MAG: phosphoribosylanthranilate isomerase [Rectinemataceae bacterium]